eukprot:jgi/Psemu1/306956/fgenesh1_kg.292_\
MAICGRQSSSYSRYSYDSRNTGEIKTAGSSFPDDTSNFDGYILPSGKHGICTIDADDLSPSWLAAEAVVKMMDTSYYHASHKSTGNTGNP